MITNPLFRECLANVSDETRAEFNLSFEIADRIDALLKKKGITQKELAAKMGKTIGTLHMPKATTFFVSEGG